MPPEDKVEKDYIEYEVIQESVFSYSNSEVMKNAGYFLMSAIVFILALAGVAAVGLYFREPFLIILAFPVLLIGGFYLNNYRLFIKMFFLPQSDDVDRCIDGKYVHKGSDGNYTVYEKTAQCNFPRCEGIVKIHSAPPRERHKHEMIGRCSLDPNLHTYTVDFNGTGYFKEFDFRPLPQETK
ncbi:hypothetical protein [Microbulbifer sp. PAAF003]|uniref:hypothetical protein n=1 Tax=Microbulbifer sp. PAAF003 TaxID=3243375 RepID=UPI00403A22A1